MKRMALLLAFIVNSCVTVNIYFPAAAVERAADEIVKETWGGRTESAPKEPPRSLLPTAARRIAAIVSPAKLSPKKPILMFPIQPFAL